MHHDEDGQTQPDVLTHVSMENPTLRYRVPMTGNGPGGESTVADLGHPHFFFFFLIFFSQDNEIGCGDIEMAISR